jgi:hypothetical protein
MVMSARGKTAPRRGKGGDAISWANTNLTSPKMKKIHATDSVATNGR